jgi:hypothetical protein
VIDDKRPLTYTLTDAGYGEVLQKTPVKRDKNHGRKRTRVRRKGRRNMNEQQTQNVEGRQDVTPAGGTNEKLKEAVKVGQQFAVDTVSVSAGAFLKGVCAAAGAAAMTWAIERVTGWNPFR